MPERILLRPFQEYIERESHLPLFEIGGSIQGDRYIVTLKTLGTEVALDTVQVGRDELGDYAVVMECERELPDGFKLRLEVEHDEFSPAGGVIDVFFEGRAREAAEAELRAQRIDPASVMLLTPHERHWSVHFSCVGKVDGRGSSYVGSGEKPPVN